MLSPNYSSLLVITFYERQEYDTSIAFYGISTFQRCSPGNLGHSDFQRRNLLSTVRRIRHRGQASTNAASSRENSATSKVMEGYAIQLNASLPKASPGLGAHACRQHIE